MAVFIPAQGVTRVVHPKEGRAFSLSELQAFVGGYIELIAAPDNRVMFINEHGKLESLPLNEQATALAWFQGLHPDDYIAGDVIVCTRVEAGEDLE